MQVGHTQLRVGLTNVNLMEVMNKALYLITYVHHTAFHWVLYIYIYMCVSHMLETANLYDNL